MSKNRLWLGSHTGRQYIQLKLSQPNNLLSRSSHTVALKLGVTHPIHDSKVQHIRFREYCPLQIDCSVKVCLIDIDGPDFES